MALAFALLSGIGRYDTALFSVHMVQHVLLMLVAAPLLALAAPITLILRVSSPATRQRWVLPVLHSQVVRFMGHPVTAWLMFAAMMWAVHFSPLFNASLEDPLLHDLEHVLFLTGALFFWWPAVALDPMPAPDEPSGPDRLPVHPDDPEHVPGVRHPQRDRRALPALRDARPAVGSVARSTISGSRPGSCGSSVTPSS